MDQKYDSDNQYLILFILHENDFYHHTLSNKSPHVKYVKIYEDRQIRNITNFENLIFIITKRNKLEIT